MENITNKSINAIRILTMDAVEKAQSGHPGLPLGCAPLGYELYANHLNHDPKDPSWPNRDRFILSAGHGSMLIYSLLHLFGYNLSIEELQNFRQWQSKTPGHPEVTDTEGVETTTGPLGAGLSNSVGMAMAEAHLATVFNREGYPIVDHYTYVLAGDGCMMEGVSSEAMSMAGTMGLDKLIVLYDSNQITIEGGTDLAFHENVRKRFEAYGFQVLHVRDGNNLEKIAEAIETAKSDTKRPTLIEINTEIGYGSPRVGTNKAHSDPMGPDAVASTRETLNWTNADAFKVDQDVYDHYREKAQRGQQAHQEWNELFERYAQEYPELAEKWAAYHQPVDVNDLLNDEELWEVSDKPSATRNSSGEILNKLNQRIPNLFGGSADLAPSNKTQLNGETAFSKDNKAGKNIHWGVREHAMVGAANGILLHGGLRSYTATFLVFADFFKPMARLAALMKLPQIYVMTHDSVFVGEDGPTHQPIEQLTMMRAQPNTVVFRPADATETVAGWVAAITSTETPTLLALTRQNVPSLAETSKEALKGGYTLYNPEGSLDGILIASGSEVSLALKAKDQLQAEGINVRVVSMPSIELFKQQDLAYQEQILPKEITKRLALEAGSPYSWHQFVGFQGDVIGLETFGASAPGQKVYEEYGFTVENVVDRFKQL